MSYIRIISVAKKEITIAVRLKSFRLTAIILFVLLMAPMLNQWFFGLVFWFVDLFGAPGGLVAIGGQLTRFWSAWF